MVSLEKNDRVMLARQLPLKSVALILAGGRGTRLKDLTNKRADRVGRMADTQEFENFVLDKRQIDPALMALLRQEAPEKITDLG
ncbi:bifunctional isocitrate dehydrogenase kinase/phosphatase, partial [Salmonella enterica subsp. enterica serovar Cerro]|nr:bifunctional isocitrate dehydrogenase kinase/phosphatase [Salmonella enterica subsp. enterica serovar Cerro]